MPSRTSKRRVRGQSVGAEIVAPRADATELALADASDLLVEAYELLASVITPAAAVDVATQMLEDLAIYDMERTKPH